MCKVLEVLDEFRVFALIALLFLVSAEYPVSAQNVTYKWENLKVGGGGYVTGIVIHPANKDVMYIRTDVGGAYRWDKQSSSWKQMLGWVSPLNANLIGVDGIALDPDNPDRVYLALGQRIDEPGGVYRSENRGETWEKLLDVSFEGNGRNARWVGECIAVDPLNSKIIYAGTRREGLWRSVDDGKSWKKVDGVPEGYTGVRPTGIRSVVFDKADGDQRSETIYAGIPYKGIFVSNDGGETFGKIPGSPLNPARMQVVDRELFVTHDKGVSIYYKGNWKDVTPVPGRNYVALAVDETNSGKMVVAQRYGRFYNPIYRTQDKGQTWEEINSEEVPAKLNVTIPWWPRTRFSSATAGMALVPGGSGELFYTDWFGVWQTPNVWSETTEWNTVVQGHEETVVLSLIAPPEGPLLYSGVADVSGFIHESTRDYVTEKISDYNEVFSISVSESNPSFVAHLGAKSWGGEKTTLIISDNYGKNRVEKNIPADETLGRIALSSANPDKIVYVSGTGNLYYSIDGGDNWLKSKNGPSDVIQLENIWNRNRILAADPVDGGFYLFSKGRIFYSEDGNTWKANPELPVAGLSDRFHNVLPVPGQPGNVWLSLGTDGLWRSNDRGRSFTKIDAFENARLMCWGAPAPGSDIPTAYVYGVIRSEWGMFRSVDMGKSWLRINDDKNQFPAGVAVIDADKNLFGRIYVGSGGYGISYGEPIEKDVDTAYKR